MPSEYQVFEFDEFDAGRCVEKLPLPLGLCIVVDELCLGLIDGDDDLLPFVVLVVVLLTDDAILNHSLALVQVVIRWRWLTQKLNVGLALLLQPVEFILLHTLEEYLGGILDRLSFVLTRLRHVVCTLGKLIFDLIARNP